MIIADLIAYSFYEDDERYEYAPKALFFNSIYIPYTDQTAVIPDAQLDNLRKSLLGEYMMFGRKQERIPFFRWLVFGCPAPDTNSLIYDWSFNTHASNVLGSHTTNLRTKTIA